MAGACDRCLARAWLISRLAPHLERARRHIAAVLELGDAELIDAVAGRHAAALRRELAEFDPADARERAAGARIELICSCRPAYPRRLAELPSPPAVLHIAGGLDRFLALTADEPVAIVGSRRPSPYGADVARSLGRGLAAAGLTVVSGMALGIDCAAHAGTVAAGAGALAVLPAGPERAYPPAKRVLYRQLLERGCAVSELPPHSQVWRWTFPARNRIIAGLSAMTVVVEATERSGALLTAATARSQDRAVGAVPGRVTSELARGPNALLADGASLVRGPQDVLDRVFGAGVRAARGPRRPELGGRERKLLAVIGEAPDALAAFSAADLSADAGLQALAALELSGYIRRTPGGQYSVLP